MHRGKVRREAVAVAVSPAHWKGLHAALLVRARRDGRAVRDAQAVSRRSGATIPTGSTSTPRSTRLIAGRASRRWRPKGAVDWAFGEALAFGSLLLENTPVRLSGQDSRRGTFSQRHAVLVDYQTGERYIAAQPPRARSQAELCVYDSLLSEAAVLGFDYGYSLDEPHMLIAWEAQFGDFANGAQVIIDQFIASGESKWGRASGLVMLLPHGYEGQGPEHSSARLERYLSALRRGEHPGGLPVHARAVFPPAAPASAAQLPQTSDRDDAQEPAPQQAGGLAGRAVRVGPVPGSARRRGGRSGQGAPRAVVQRQGLLRPARKAREAGKHAREVAIVRLEQFYPWPADAAQGRPLAAIRKAREWVWVQEESQNMGGWTFAAPRLQELMGFAFQYVGRDASASPATGLTSRPRPRASRVGRGGHRRRGSLPHLVTAHPQRPDVPAFPVKQGVI